MARIAQDKRMQVVVGIALAFLLLAVAFLSFNAYAVEEGSASAATSNEASSSSAVAESAATPEAKKPESKPESSSASASSSVPAAPDDKDAQATATTLESYVAAQVKAALEREVVPAGHALAEIEGIHADTGGSVFTFVSPINATEIPGDLYWVGNRVELSGSKIDNDVLAAGFQGSFVNSDVAGDVRIASQSALIDNSVIKGNADVLALDIMIDGSSAANGFYCGGGTIDFKGASKRFIAYGQSIYFDGTVDGDVTLSAQDIVIGPHAKVSGLLDIRSGQSLEVLDIPATAQIAHIDTNLDHPNTIDQITQIRAAIAPYFQIGSLLFVVVSFILLGLAALWGFGQKLTEANRLVRRYPLAVLVLGCIALMLMFVIVMLGTVLIFTIPLSIVVALILIISAIFCVPFTGASVALMFRKRFKPALCVILGSGIGAALLFVPYVNQLVFLVSMIYFVGYVVNIAMFGHDERHDASFHARQADEDAPKGKARGILPVAVEESNADPED
ncbi:MAG: hypothetical protein Q4D27_01605 [Coriobacteriia bacterium]|nr:hypothetical protein [Coriobacteriia bacterium]